MKKILKSIYLLFDLAFPLIGIICFFTHFYVGLYICAAYGFLFALQRIPRSDPWPIIWTAIDAVIALLLYKHLRISYWPLLSGFICAYNLFSMLFTIPTMIKMYKAYREAERQEEYLYDDYDDEIYEEDDQE